VVAVGRDEAAGARVIKLAQAQERMRRCSYVRLLDRHAPQQILARRMPWDRSRR